jgi:glycerol-3-phosphate dehydrogenase
MSEMAAAAESPDYDLLIVGAGINGAVAAACLSARGATVALIDKGDFASFTSQESSNLAWGGIKYMETFDFALVRKLCLSRNHLIRNYPSIVEEIRFLTSVPKGFRHSRMKLYAGTWPEGKLFRIQEGDEWEDCGRLGDSTEWYDSRNNAVPSPDKPRQPVPVAASPKTLQ